MNILELLGFRCSSFREYERLVLESVSEGLEPKASNLFEEQLKRVNFIQRHSSDKEVNMYRMRLGKPFFESGIGFPNNVTEALLASVEIEIDYTVDVNRNIDRVTAEIWMVKGWVFSIIFNAIPSVLKDRNYKMVNIVIHENPMSHPLDDSTEGNLDRLELLFGDAIQIEKIKSNKKPLSESDIEDKTKNLRCVFPKDWIDMLKLTNGFEYDGCIVHGLSSARRVVTKKSNYIILAEGLYEKALAINCQNAESIIYSVNLEDETEAILGSVFKDALVKYIRKEL